MPGKAKPRVYAHKGQEIEIVGPHNNAAAYVNGREFAAGYKWRSIRAARAAAVSYIDRHPEKFMQRGTTLPFCIPVSWTDAAGDYWLAYHHAPQDSRLYSVLCVTQGRRFTADYLATVDDFGNLVRVAPNLTSRALALFDRLQGAK